MPNHVTTIVNGPKDLLEAITRTHTEEERIAHEEQNARTRERFEASGREVPFPLNPLDMNEQFIDFEMLIPQPANIETGGCSGQHDEGVVCWYAWNVYHWGTKWNGYDLQIDHPDDETLTLTFDTAWSHPFPVMQALSQKFPNDLISVDYADEDLGQNTGQYVLLAGEITQSTELDDGSDEALDFAAQLKYGQTWSELQTEFEREEAEFEAEMARREQESKALPATEA